MKTSLCQLQTHDHHSRVRPVALACAAIALSGSVWSQTQVVKPAFAHYWMDVATMSMVGMDEMPSMGGGLGGMLGGMAGVPGMGGASFGATRGMMPGRWLDLAVQTQRKPGGTDATQAIPQGQNMGPSLNLLPVKAEPRTQGERAQRDSDEMPQRPKGRILFYWGCSETVRPGQPRVLDFATTGVEDYGKFMMGRSVRDTGAKAEPGHSIWPNEKNRQNVPKDASLVGQHAISGEGLPDSLKFAIGEQQDFMPKLELSGSGGGAKATALTWAALPTARAYFLNAMSGSENEMVIWSSSDVPEPGWGLMDYASNANVDKWLKEKVLLPTTQTQCAIPAGIFAKAQGAMARGIAYGQELNLVHPPRPTDKRIPWEQEWVAKVRVKSVAMLPLGEDGPQAGRSNRHPSKPGAENQRPENQEQPKGEQDKNLVPGLPDVGKALKGLFGR
jgi:hypothetical protein